MIILFYLNLKNYVESFMTSQTCKSRIIDEFEPTRESQTWITTTWKRSPLRTIPTTHEKNKQCCQIFGWLVGFSSTTNVAMQKGWSNDNNVEGLETGDNTDELNH